MSLRLAFSLLLAVQITPQLSEAKQFPPPSNFAPEIEKSEENSQRFGLNSALLKPDSTARRFVDAIDSIAATNNLLNIHIEGSASPDGPVWINDRLARLRAESFKSFILEHADVDDSLFTIRVIAENWERLAELYPPAAKIIDSIHDCTARETALRRLNGGSEWPRLRREILPQLRYVTAKARYREFVRTACDSVSSEIREIEYVSLPSEPAPEEEAPCGMPLAPLVEHSSDLPPPWQRRIYIKTNALAWSMLWINAACEVDFSPHWSGMLPIYYSGFDYFTSHRKFRTFTVLPEVRYWLREENQGFFAGAHIGFCFFNVALEDNDTRYQDHDGRRPAYGGGLSVGYRFDFCRNSRWKMEVSLGAGVYSLYYDTFRNEHNGLLTGSRRRTFFGIDNAAVSFCYQFDLGRRKTTK